MSKHLHGLSSRERTAEEGIKRQLLMLRLYRGDSRYQAFYRAHLASWRWEWHRARQARRGHDAAAA
jgi:hypothetical protein